MSEWQQWQSTVQENGVLYLQINIPFSINNVLGLLVFLSTKESNWASGYTHDKLTRGDTDRDPFWLYFHVYWAPGLDIEPIANLKFGVYRYLGTVREFANRMYRGQTLAFEREYCHISWHDIDLYKTLDVWIGSYLGATVWHYYTAGLSYRYRFGIDIFRRERRWLRSTNELVSLPIDVRYKANWSLPERVWKSPQYWWQCDDCIIVGPDGGPSGWASAWTADEYHPQEVLKRMTAQQERMDAHLRLDTPAIRIYWQMVAKQRQQQLAKVSRL